MAVGKRDTRPGSAGRVVELFAGVGGFRLGLQPSGWETVWANQWEPSTRTQHAAECYEKASDLMDADYHSAGMLECCYLGLGDFEARRGASRKSLERVEKALESNPRDAAAYGNGAMSSSILGEAERAREFGERALALEPENYILRYNIACAFIELGDNERALDLIEESLSHLGVDHIRHARADPDIAAIRDHPRFAKMIEDARRRLGVTLEAGPIPQS